MMPALLARGWLTLKPGKSAGGHGGVGVYLSGTWLIWHLAYLAPDFRQEQQFGRLPLHDSARVTNPPLTHSLCSMNLQMDALTLIMGSW